MSGFGRNGGPPMASDPQKTLLDHVALHFMIRRSGMPIAILRKWMERGGDTGESQAIVDKARDDAATALAAIQSFPGEPA